MRRRTGTALVLSLALGLLAAAPQARAQSCGELWVAINSIYKAYGYCFKTQRAISYFGNAGCRFDDMRDVRRQFSRSDQARVNRLVQRSRALGCRD